MSKSFTLKDCCDFQEGYVNPSQKQPEYFGGNIKWLRASDLNNRYVYDTERTLTEKGFESAGKSAKLFSKDTIAISKSGTIGLLGILKDEMCGNRAIINIHVKQNLSNLMYVFYTLQHKRNELINKSGGSIQKNLYISALETLTLNHVCKDDQTKIANVLSTLDQKIELNNRINAELEAMAKTLYNYWFVQFDFPNEEDKPYKSSGGKMVYNSILKREIPEGWSVDRLQSYINFKRGISYKSNEISDIQGKEFLNLNSFSLKGEFKIEGTKYFIGKYNQESLVSSGGLVVAITDVTRNADIIGKAFIIPNIFEDGALISCDVVSVTSERLNKFYLEQLFNSNYYHRYIKYYASGTLVLHLNLNGINWFNTILPPVGLLNQFEKFCKPILKKKAVILKENKQLIELRDWLLPMLMNGQVTVK